MERIIGLFQQIAPCFIGARPTDAVLPQALLQMTLKPAPSYRVQELRALPSHTVLPDCVSQMRRRSSTDAKCMSASAKCRVCEGRV
jgi:hypothetical protein